MAESDLIWALLSPQLWWLWESFIFFMYFVLKFARHWGKDRHIILRWSGSSWQQIGEYWIGATQKWFRSKSKKSFISEPGAAAFSSSDLSGNHLTVIHDYDKARPRDVKIDGKTPQHLPPATSLKAEITKDKKGLDPNSQALDTYLAEQAWKQGLKANASSRPDLIMLLVIGAGAFAFGMLLGPQLFPHNVVVPVAAPP